MKKFDVGDLVICIDSREDWLMDNSLELCSFHRVLHTNNDYIRIDNHDHSSHYGFSPARFNKIEKTKLIRLIFE